MTNRNPVPLVAIIGGGFSGGGVAFNLARRQDGVQARIVVLEPRETLGTGLAYDTVDPVHRINVPASRMSLDPSTPDDFSLWLSETDYVATDPAARTPDGNVFPRRGAFGAYVWSRIAPFVEIGAIEHIRAHVSKLERIGARWRVSDENGQTLDADCVIIATTHPAPTAPRMLASMLEGHPRFITDATVPNALSPIRADDTVLVVGNGLTSADAITSLLGRGHVGQITSISRRGLRSRGHAATPQEAHGDFTNRPIATARLLTRRVREAIEQAELFGSSWHAAIDAARSQGQAIWNNLALKERQRLVRHLRPFWDVHRFRIAPQLEQALNQATASGRLETLAASIAAVSYHAGRIRAALRLSRSNETLIRDFDAVIVTTGPSHNAIIDSQDYLTTLADAGSVTLDPTRLGIACDAHSRVLDKTARPVPGLFLSGPLARGTFGELMGLPQVSEHAVLVASEVDHFLKMRLKSIDAA